MPLGVLHEYSPFACSTNDPPLLSHPRLKSSFAANVFLLKRFLIVPYHRHARAARLFTG